MLNKCLLVSHNIPNDKMYAFQVFRSWFFMFSVHSIQVILLSLMALCNILHPESSKVSITSLNLNPQPQMLHSAAHVISFYNQAHQKLAFRLYPESYSFQSLHLINQLQCHYLGWVIIGWTGSAPWRDGERKVERTVSKHSVLIIYFKIY